MAEDEKRADEDFFTTLKKTVAENVYFDYEHDNDDQPKKIETTSSTFRVDSSDLISRCRTFLPMLTDANRILLSKIQSGENVRIELDSDEEDEEEKQRIEMNLMFCRNDDESSSSSEEDEEILPTTIKNSAEKKIVEIDSKEKEEEKSLRC